MNKALVHRGPDGSGHFIDEAQNLYLTHTRLSIVDISYGQQPMTTADGRYTIVFNGEIYNHPALRAELEKLGHLFVTDHSDTEVILIGYRQFGREILLKLNGMFSFVIYDQKENILFFARDRFGEKPFYYFHSKGCFAFASELTALRAHHKAPQNESDLAFIKFMGYGYIPSPHTIVKGAYKLPAGYAGTFDLLKENLNTFQYWRYQIEPEDIPFTKKTLSDKTDELESLIEISVKDRMVCDVPLGVLLSGGLDSGVVTAYAQKHLDVALLSFSIGFHEKSYDESYYSNYLADYLGASHNLNYFDVDSLIARMPDYLSDLDEPLGDASYLPTSLLCEQARQSVTVALSGDGGDELFFGYDPFDAAYPASWIDMFVPPPFVRIARFASRKMPPSDKNMSLDFKLKRFLQGFDVASPARIACWMAPMTPGQISDLYGRTINEEEIYSEAYEIWEESEARNPVDRMGEFFTRLYLADDILMKTDRGSMRVGLELRAPLLDYDIAEFARKLPSTFKYQRGRRKLILKEVGKRLLPSSVVKRRKKGFGIPLSAWMREFGGCGHTGGLFAVNDQKASAIWERHKNKKEDWRFACWNDLVLSFYAGNNREEKQ